MAGGNNKSNKKQAKAPKKVSNIIASCVTLKRSYFNILFLIFPLVSQYVCSCSRLRTSPHKRNQNRLHHAAVGCWAVSC